MQKSYEGFGYGIKTVMQAKESWCTDVLGVIAELMQVENEYVAAIETALGVASQNIVVKSADSAKQAIAFLKKRQAGRATFLPLDTIQKRIKSFDEQELVKINGIRGFAADLIDFDDKLTPIMNFLLGRVLIAENMDVSLIAAKKSNYRIRVVTLDGDVVNAGGSMTGGAKQQKDSGFLLRRKEIAEIKANIEKINKYILSLQ